METTLMIPDLGITNISLTEKIGQGAFGAVYRGRHLGLDVDVAVKILNADAGDPSIFEQALSEARLMAKLDHPNVLRIHDAGRAGSSIYLVLEIMDGGNGNGLSQVTPSRGLDLARQLLAGLQALHEARILHRDIKPANCLLRSRDDRVKLADLGIAVEEATKGQTPTELAGTLPFMAPELFDYPPRYSVSSDLYAMGMTLACMFLESKPYPTGPVGHVIAWVRGGDRPKVTANRPDMPYELTTLVDRMLAKDATRRPASASEALASLGLIALPATISAEDQTSPPDRWGPWVIGSHISSSSNWDSFAVTHARTGGPGRLSRLGGKGPMAQSSDLILASADRASRLDHPGMLDVIDWGISKGLAYLVTPPQGRSLLSLVESGGPIGELEALGYIGALAQALAYLHDRGLVYQIVDPSSAVIATDARTAQLAWPMFCVPSGSPRTGPDGKSARALVPIYAAPEAIAGCETIETPVDLYGLGQILFFLLAGTTPHRSLFGPALYVAKQAPPKDVRECNPMVTAPTARLVASLLEPDPLRRPSAFAAIEELDRLSRRLRTLKPSEESA